MWEGVYGNVYALWYDDIVFLYRYFSVVFVVIDRCLVDVVSPILVGSPNWHQIGRPI